MRVSAVNRCLYSAVLLFAARPFVGQDRPKLEFEVATVKPTAIDSSQFSRLSAAGQLKLGAEINGNKVAYRFMSVRQLVAEAYQVRPFQIVCPEWFLTDRYEVMATMPAGSRKEDARFMLQSLLAERFQMAVHREMREGPVSALVVAEGGARLTESQSATQPNAEAAGGRKAGQRRSDPSSISGLMGSAMTKFTVDTANLNVRLEGTRMTTVDLAHFLMRFDVGDGRPVVDMTGLKGEYDMILDIPMSQIPGLIAAAEAQAAATGGPPPRPAEGASDPGPGGMMRTLRSYGLELKKTNAPIEHVVVERAERKPAEN